MLEIYYQDALALISAGILSCQLLQKILQNEKKHYTKIFSKYYNDLGKPQKSYFLNGSTIREGGGGVKVLPLRKQNFFGNFSTNIGVF